MDVLNADLEFWYRETQTPHRIGKLTWDALFRGTPGQSFPCLHGPSVKAASTRALLPWLLRLCQQHLGDEFATLRLRAVAGMSRPQSFFSRLDFSRPHARMDMGSKHACKC